MTTATKPRGRPRKTATTTQAVVEKPVAPMVTPGIGSKSSYDSEPDYEAERKLRQEQRDRRIEIQAKVDDMTLPEKQAFFIKALDNTPWPRVVCEEIGISRAVPYYWARSVPEVRKALKLAAGTRHEWALEEIDEIAHGIVNAGQWRLQALQWRAGRGAMGEWLGDSAGQGGNITNITLISNIPRPKLAQPPDKVITVDKVQKANDSHTD